MVWHKLLSKQRRRAVVACFRMTPLYNIPRRGGMSDCEAHGVSTSCSSDEKCEKKIVFVLQAQSLQHVPRGLQAQLAPHGGLRVRGQDDRRPICEELLITLTASQSREPRNSFHVRSRKRWSKRRARRRRRRKPSPTRCTSSFCISVARP